ncbi:hypothetical protein PR048_023352 [Dryococelus australis]|uniref:Reverse transcriptase/retrotransposon-derived protein RNase H-like domain-containing protein n=1 Tax=Dryococelus australis TaxID=614101 RepID=A0ABQ9GTV9_9NEOP|nr:hypothetical protein PR048_023352 [Dryococelus australis]
MHFLGMLGYFPRFMDGYMEMCASLNRINMKDVPFLCGYMEARAFENLKQAISNSPILVLPDFCCKFMLQVDASSGAIGGVLLQDQGKGIQPVAYGSRTLNTCEQHLSALEKEALVCVWGVEEIVHLPRTSRQVGKIRQWIVKLNNCRFKIIYIKGKDNIIVDCLS